MRRLNSEHTRECNSHREFGAKSKRLVAVWRQDQHVLGSPDVDQVAGETNITRLPASQSVSLVC